MPARPDDVERRLTELEVKASLLEDTVDRLDRVVVAQQARIDALLDALSRLAVRLDGAGGGEARSLRDDLPPHY